MEEWIRWRSGCGGGVDEMEGVDEVEEWVW